MEYGKKLCPPCSSWQSTSCLYAFRSLTTTQQELYQLKVQATKIGCPYVASLSENNSEENWPTLLRALKKTQKDL